jgi:peptidase M1-like protein
MKGLSLYRTVCRLASRGVLLAAMLLMVAPGSAEAKFIPDPIVRYKIDARLDAQKKTIAGHETIVWKNHTAGAVPDLQFHLYLNAFKNNQSTFMKEGGSRRRRPGDPPIKPEEWGYEQVRRITVDGQDLTSKLEYIHPDDDNVNDQTVARVPLAKAVGPGRSVTIEIEWTSKMPRIFARTGYRNNYFLFAQWFPKPGVYEGAGERHRQTAGWNCHQFHSLTEFFADYGVFDARLTVPSDFEIGATGAERSRTENLDGTTTYNYYQEDVHDFAWTTEPKTDAEKITRTFEADKQVTPAEIAEWSQKTGTPPEEVKLQDVKVSLIIQREHHDQVDRHFRAIFNALKWFGLFYGKYPYDTLTVVDPIGGSGGMEYPTFITAGTQYWPAKHALSPEGVIVHEFGHQFWYGLVGNNEFEEAWLDEGFNSYSTTKVLEKAYPPGEMYERVAGVPYPAAAWTHMTAPAYPWFGVGSVPLGQYFERVPMVQMYARSGRGYWQRAQADAMERYAWLDMDGQSYGVQAYAKPEVTLLTLEALLGGQWPKIIRTYHQRYRFKHPDAIDFMNTVNEVSGRDMKWFFDQTVYGTGMLDYEVSVTTDKAKPKEGLFDQGGKPAYVGAPRGKDNDGKDKDSEKESEVLVRRLGEMQFPVTVHVRFEDGTEKLERWDGQYRWTKFKYGGRAKVASAVIDQDFNWKLQVHRTHDSYLKEPVKLAAQKWYLRWVVWLQNTMMAFSFFS